VTARYRDAFPDVDIILGACNPDLPFNRSEAILDGASKTTADTLIVSDGDVWTSGLFEALEHVEQAGWAIPHLMLCRLSEASTERVLAGENPEDQDDFAERPYKGFECGTVFVIRRDVLLDVPPDVRFVGWGGEEQSLALALNSLVGKPWRGRQPCWHLHHPPQPRQSRGVGNEANLKLYRRYKIARHDPARMRALIDEAKVPA
jgi:hypothetical protein